MTANTPTARRGAVAGWLALLLVVAGGGLAVAVSHKTHIVEAQFDWLVRNAWFPMQLLLLWLVHARLLLKDYGAERLFWEERWHTQFFSLFGDALVVGAALLTWFLSDPPGRFMTFTADWRPEVSLFGLAPVGTETHNAGRFVLAGLGLSWLLLFATKLVQVALQPAKRRWRFAASRRCFGPGLVGYLSAALFALLLHHIDYSEEFRVRAWWVFAALAGLTVAGLLAARWRLSDTPVLRNAGVLHPSGRRFWVSVAAFVLVAAAATWFLARSADAKPISEQLVPMLDDLPGGRLAERVDPAGNPVPKDLHAAAFYLSGVTLTLFALGVAATSALRGIDPRWAFNPALLLCLFVVLSDLGLGYFAFSVKTQASALGLGGAILVLWNWSGIWWRRRYRFPNLDLQYAHPKPLVGGANPALLDDTATLAAHLARLNAGEKPKKLIVVATSGGGIRAAAWTAHLLETFDRELPGWSNRVRIVTGASGGMVGAALWAGALGTDRPGTALPKRTPGFGPLADIAGTAALRPLVQTMLLRDLSLALFWPPSANWIDRGRELEAQWELAAAEYFADAVNPFRRAFAVTREMERQGERPSLVFSPTMVEDNRRCLISNLDLEAFASPVGYSRSAYELFKLFPDATDSFTLGTAARMNATFPIVGPLVPLPTEPPRRLMDAGLYDNYGIEFLSNWLLAHRAELAASAGVVLIEIRAFPLAARGQGPSADDPDMRSANPATALGEAAAILTGPLGALVRGRGNIMYHRNNAILADVAAGLGTKFERVVFELDEEASLNWYLSEQERRAIASYDTAEMVGKLRAALL